MEGKRAEKEWRREGADEGGEGRAVLPQVDRRREAQAVEQQLTKLSLRVERPQDA